MLDLDGEGKISDNTLLMGLSMTNWEKMTDKELADEAQIGVRGQGAAESGKAKERRGCQPRNYPWAQLMTRVFGFDVLTCPRFGAKMRILAAINPPAAIQKILGCLGLPT
jgi:hypothetical protein